MALVMPVSAWISAGIGMPGLISDCQRVCSPLAWKRMMAIRSPDPPAGERQSSQRQ